MTVDNHFAPIGGVRLVDEDRRLGMLFAAGDLSGETVYRFFLVHRRPRADVVVIDAGPGNMYGPVPCASA